MIGQHGVGDPTAIVRRGLRRCQITIPSALQLALEAEWAFLASCGTWFSGAERVAIAAAARAEQPSRAGDRVPADASPVLAPSVIEAATALATSTSTITDQVIERWESAGLNRFELVEVVGVVARLSAVDTFVELCGLPLFALPRPLDGTPRRRAPRKAKQRASRLPTIRAGAIGALSGVPPEAEARRRLHSALFGIDGVAALPGLDRSQREFVAVKVSIVNECVY